MAAVVSRSESLIEPRHGVFPHEGESAPPFATTHHASPEHALNRQYLGNHLFDSRVADLIKRRRRTTRRGHQTSKLLPVSRQHRRLPLSDASGFFDHML